jgi:DNA-binding response OmpR family regulator
MTISDLLTAEGHRVESVSDGDAGLARATQEKFALIILDVMLPKKLASKFAVSSGKVVSTPLS